MKQIFILTLCCILSACCSTKKYAELLDTRLGMTEQELIEQLGDPTAVSDSDGTRSLEYTQSTPYCTDCHCGSHWCTTQYSLKDGKVFKWLYKGNSCCI